jgi:gamma-glutamyltranspeptidase / glutathione hydrolase
MSGLGGVATMVYHHAASGRTVVVDGSSTAPSAARPDTFELAASGVGGLYGWPGTVGDAQNTGYRAPVVPGMPAGMLHSLARYGSGRLSRSQVMAPAIRLAEEGFPVDPYVATTTALALRRLRAFPETMRVYFADDGTPLQPASLARGAERLIQPDLARTLLALADHGASVLYEGEIGDRLVADLQANGGLIARRDLSSYRVRELEPLAVDYRGHTLLGIPNPSGNATAFEALNILEQFDLAALGHGSVEATHLVAEANRRAFLDRFAHLADPELQSVPIDGLLSKAYAAELASAIDLERANPDAAAGDPWRHQSGRAAPRHPALDARVPTPADRSCTTHITVVDAERNVVSLTSTLGELFGSGVVARGTGILLNNGMTWFNPVPGHVNSIQPGKRILYAFTPTVVLREGRPLLGVGAPGGRRILSAVVQSLVNALDFGLGIQAAVSAPRVHVEGPTTEAEARLPSDVLDGLRRLGHRLHVIAETSTSFSFARPNGIKIDPHTGRLTGGVNQFVPAWAMGH